MSKKVLGLWNMGEELFHKKLSPDEAKRIIRSALRENILSFDSAYSYKNADTFLSSVLKEQGIERDKAEIISKVMPVPTLIKKAEASLRRLNTDHFDILLLHWPSDSESIFSSLKALEKLKAEKKALNIGVSNFPPSILKEYSNDFDITHHERPLSLIWNKEWEEEKSLKLKTIAYAPFGMGLLTGKKYEDRRSTLPAAGSPILEELLYYMKTLAEKYSVKVTDIAYSWVEAQNAEYIVFGASSEKHLKINSIVLSEEEINNLTLFADKLSSLSSSDNIFSHCYLP